MASSLNPERSIRRARAAVDIVLRSWAGKLESQAKSKAKWTDRTGQARNSIHSGIEHEGDYVVLYLSHGSRHGSFLETGTGLHGPRRAKYPIKAKNKKALFWAGANNPVRSVMHPGIKAQPVVKPTLEAAMPQIRADVRRVLSAARGGTT